MNKRATIGDVARLAGVSTATVSRTIHTPDVVSESTRRAVFDAIDSTGFTLNTAAQNLRQQRANAVLVLVPDIGNIFFSEILSGIEREASAAGLTILIGDTAGDEAREERLLNDLLNGRADGALLLNGHLPDNIGDRLTARTGGLPIVSVSEAQEAWTIPHVGIDNVRAAVDATLHLLDLGHRRIAHLAGPSGNILSRQRLEGFRNALSAESLNWQDADILEGDFTIESGMSAAEHVLALPTRPTAVFCANDEMAIGLISVLTSRGVRVPEDISVIGFDDISFAKATTPPLTTIRQPRQTIGETAMRRLLATLQGAEPGNQTILPHELVVRASTARV